jgi:GTP:adenosylcobinamide-phosphate guanylyltransferase
VAYAALVLAGRRGGGDPLDGTFGARHPALTPVADVPMLLRVVRALEQARMVEGLAVSIDETDALDSLAALSDRRARGTLHYHTSLSSPSRSVRDALGDCVTLPALVTTADHALLTPEIVDHFLHSADAHETDVAIGLVPETVVRSAYPSTTRTYLRFRDGGYSGANLFAFRTPQAHRASEFWVSAEQFRKRPWRLASVFGPGALLAFAFRRLTLDEALERASRVIGCRVRAIVLPFAEAAIDVDRPSDVALATQILRSRAEGG